MAYSFSHNCTKNYWNWTTTVKIIADGWVVYFFCNTIQLTLFILIASARQRYAQVTGKCCEDE